jgi:adenylate cyclase
MVRILAVTACLFLFVFVLNAREDQTLVKITKEKSTFEFTGPWNYHPGDDTLWSDPRYNDSQWDTLSSIINLASHPDSIFKGYGWFRISIRIDSSMRNQSFALYIDQQGASEVYLNGKLIQKFGSFGKEDTVEMVTNPKWLPGIIQFTDSLDYVISVRYSNLEAHHNYKRYRKEEAGFTMVLGSFQKVMENINDHVTVSFFILFLFMIFLILSLIHFLLFLFYRRQKSNLYYSIFMILFSSLIFITFLTNSVSEYPPLINKAGFIILLLFPLFFVPLIGFLYSLFMKSVPRFFWITVGTAIILSVLYYLNVSFINVLYVSFVLLLWIEVTRVVIIGLIRKFDGAWILGTGVLFFILFFTIIIVYIISYGSLTFNGSSTGASVFFILLLFAILSIPLSMSVYLARDFAKTNINLLNQLEQVKILSEKNLQQEKEKKRILENQKEQLEIQVAERTKELEWEKEKTEELLLNTLPLKVVNELKQNGKSEPESFEDVTVYFSDLVGFTTISSELEPGELIDELNQLFTGFDDIMERNGCERIKTIGDAYLAVCGMPERNENHAENMIHAAVAIKRFLEERNLKSQIQWQIRIGIHSGRVVGGIVGVKKYIYDVFGDTINTTSRMESNSKAMCINVSDTTYSLLKNRFAFIAREPMEIKGKGLMQMYFLDC